jgi:hypothetical protein
MLNVGPQTLKSPASAGGAEANCLRRSRSASTAVSQCGEAPCGWPQMSQFNPTVHIISPEHEPDLLAGAVFNSLTRPLYYAESWGIVRSFVLSGLTLGLLPTVLIPRWLRNIAAEHQQQLWHAAEWLRLQTADPRATALQDSTRQIRLSLALAGATWLCIAVAISALAGRFVSSPFGARAFYQFGLKLPRSPESIVFGCAMTVAGISNWLHLTLHQRRVAQFVRLFNEMMIQLKMEPVAIRTETGVRPLWVISALALSVGGAIWPLPTLLAAAAHRRYTMVQSVRLRTAIAERLRQLLAQRRPVMQLPRPVMHIRECIRPNCRAQLPQVAAFCPRCGTRAAEAMEIVA